MGARLAREAGSRSGAPEEGIGNAHSTRLEGPARGAHRKTGRPRAGQSNGSAGRKTRREAGGKIQRGRVEQRQHGRGPTGGSSIGTRMARWSLRPRRPRPRGAGERLRRRRRSSLHGRRRRSGPLWQLPPAGAARQSAQNTIKRPGSGASGRCSRARERAKRRVPAHSVPDKRNQSDSEEVRLRVYSMAAAASTGRKGP